MTQDKRKAGALANISVAQRVYLLVLFPLLLMLCLTAGAIFVVNEHQKTLEEVRTSIRLVDDGNDIISLTQQDYLLLLHEVQAGTVDFQPGIDRLTASKAKLLADIEDYQIQGERRGIDTETMAAKATELADELEKGLDLLKNGNPTALDNYVQGEMISQLEPILAVINDQVSTDIQRTYQALDASISKSRLYLLFGFAAIAAGVLLAFLLGWLIYRSINTQIERLLLTIRDIAAGDLNARVQLSGKNELVELGNAFDGMVEERIAIQRRINEDHKQLNDSVFGLLEAVSDLSDRDLTVRATVTEDATGPLADAINQLAEETGDVLKQVRQEAISVESSANEVNQHTLSVSELAQTERHEAEEAVNQLEQMLSRLDQVTASAQHAGQVADTASQETLDAQNSVAQTLQRIAGVRRVVQDTGKRLKRLGERSQEISRIVDILRNISERTTVLALNASMQATAAGESGRGFSVIAEEIQRLAESAGESSEQISTLVGNIQQEAGASIATMDNTIAEVVSGTEQAEKASQQMQTMLAATKDLIHAVQQITQASADQVSINEELRIRAQKILDSTQATGMQLSSLTQLTHRMEESGQRLMKSVDVFHL